MVAWPKVSDIFYVKYFIRDVCQSYIENITFLVSWKIYYLG